MHVVEFAEVDSEMAEAGMDDYSASLALEDAARSYTEAN